MKHTVKTMLTVAAFGAAIATGAAAQQGVSDDEIVIGSNGDLSGPFAPFFIQAVKAVQMRVDQVNDAGGINGRKIRYIVEDHGYQVPKSMANFNKLINSDKVFAMILNLGTSQVIPGFKMMEARQVANISPLSTAVPMLEGDLEFKYTSYPPYLDQINKGIHYLREELGAGDKLCAMYIPNDYGTEVLEGATLGAEETGMTLVAQSTHKPDESEFVGALSKLKDADCDVVATALSVRQLIITLGTAKKIGWTDVKFLAGAPSYHEAVAAQVGVTDGLYVASPVTMYTERMDLPEVKAWYDAFTGLYDNEQPGMAAMLGHVGIDTLVRALEAAGPDLTPESLRSGMESLNYRDDIVGIDVNYAPERHIGSEAIFLTVVENGAYKTLGQN
ncbi:ABC transporter substrate-binding protein [Chachezhania sediminis]|uniref:ABC transporter substrate-binding protein n=1 Tax=Chachezhania sediminis TaxID=2599291 RepID=UPI00131C869D|nr:ABC transporter substrate-binding protein [Chachezhania sediminis]